MNLKAAFISARRWMYVPTLLGVLCLVPLGALADTPGIGATADPTFDEGIAYSLGFTVTAGDVVICEAGTPCDDSTPANWSDVLVFYNSATGPFAADSSGDADSVYVFSDDNGTLALFLANYNGLSNNHVTITENPNGLTNYSEEYLVNSPEGTTVPEPGSFMLLGSGLLGMAGVLRRKLIRSS
jgi:hypothetical protein